MKFCLTLYSDPERYFAIDLIEFKAPSVKAAKIEALCAVYDRHAYSCVLRKQETYRTCDGEKHTYGRCIARFSHGDGGWTGYK